MEKHTPTPWRINGTNSMIVTDDRVICELGVNEHLEKFSYEEYKANSELIVKAVNNHEQLVKALREAQKLLQASASEVERPELERFLSGGYKESIQNAVFKDSLGIDALLSQLESK